MSAPSEHPRRLSIWFVLRESAMPFFLFSAVLFGLFILSWLLLLPHFTRIEIAGSLHTIDSLRIRREELQQKTEVAEQKRSEHVLAVRDETFLALRSEKHHTASFQTLRTLLLRVADESAEQPDAVHLSGMTYNRGEGIVQIRGDVRFVGPRSMTILAQFIERLQEQSLFAAVTMPRFVREDDPKIGPRSPFAITVTLR